MDYVSSGLATEIILFAADAVFSLLLLKGYNKTVKYIKCLQEVTTEGEKRELEDIQCGDKSYVMVHGPVKALGNTIPSAYVPNTFGVIQRMSTSELIMTRKSSGYWWDETRPIHQSYNVVPFAIVVGKHVVKVEDVLLADEIHLDVVYNKYDRIVHSLAGNLWSFVSGVHQFGLQTTEEMLKEGTVVTGIGELSVLKTGRSLLPPSDKPYIITTQSIPTLLKDLRDRKTLYGSLLLVTGSLALFFGSLLLYRLWINLKKRKEKYDIQRKLEESRRSRRQNARDYSHDTIPDSLRCVVCQDNPKEVIMLPCGHLCACEDCSARLGSSCPICRAHVVTKAAAFLS